MIMDNVLKETVDSNRKETDSNDTNTMQTMDSMLDYVEVEVGKSIRNDGKQERKRNSWHEYGGI